MSDPGFPGGPSGPDLEAAAARLRTHLLPTPLEHSPALSRQAGVPVHLKLECFQPTRSFKVRGALNAVLAADPTPAVVVAASAGNHGLGLARAARQVGARAVLYVPRGAPETKVRRIEELGAEVREVPGTYDDAEAEAAAWAHDEGHSFIHAFHDPLVVAGQGTMGLEIAAALPDVRVVVVPVGGGGLITGTGVALQAVLAPAPRILGAQSELTRAMHDAFAAGRVVPTRVVATLADGLAGGVTEASYLGARAVAEAVHLVPERTLAPAVRFLYREHGVVAEGSAAVAIAAILEGRLRLDGPTVVVVSGGNIDADRLARILADS